MPATLAAVKELLAAGKAEEARTLVTELVKAEPGNAEVLAAFEGLHLAEGVKRATRARDRRRAEILKLPREDLDYRDPPEVDAAFDASVACFDEVLARNPASVKAMLLRAGVLHAKQRDRERTVGLLQAALKINPAAKDVQMNLRKLMRPCAACEDTGFCSECHGRGIRKRLWGESRCERCLGQGICRRCSIL